MSEPDSVVMAAGMARMLSPDSSFAESILYGRQLNPGIYFIFRAVYPLLFDSPRHIIGFLNWFGVLSASFITWPLYSLFRKLYNPVISTGALLIFIFSPITWELGTYFHPVMPALVLALISFHAFSRISSSLKGVLFFIVTFITFSAAVIMRTEVLFLIPPAAVYILFSKKKLRNLILLLVVFTMSVISYFSLLSTIAIQSSSGGLGITGFAERFLAMYFKPITIQGVLKSMAWAFMGMGSAMLVSILFCFIYDLREKFRKGMKTKRTSRRVITASLFWILPSMLIWLLYPVPITRHFFIIIPAFILIFSELMFTRFQNSKAVLIIISIIVLNLVFPELLYRTYNSINPESKKEPHGTFFYYHSRVNDRISRYIKMQMELVNPELRDSYSSKRIFVPVNWESYGYALLGMAETGNLVHLDTKELSPGTFIHDYAIRGRKITLAFSNRFSGKSVPEIFLERMVHADEDNSVLLIPEELAETNINRGISEKLIRTY
ncbi:MAG: hypothetical protein GF417_02180 [Candidatus Latescibacteria bacterium]|nr:hypothetical protein [bacterium]MBD3423237.1 hypothetical protein [Candidatus Latescibacterota bacterium]